LRTTYPATVSNHYFGIRRLPYSTDFTKNALTFRHISNGVPLPSGIPIFPNSSANSEVHNTGEIWATMLWESYAAPLRDTLGPAPRLTFDQARDRMRAYLVASLKMTPSAPTILEARDALLAAAYVNDQVDFVRFCEAFARRGAGVRAVAPDRFSTTNAGVVESFICGNNLDFVAARLDYSVASCDQDGVLDNVEIGRLTVTVKNTGAGPLSSSTATISSSNPAVSFPGGKLLSLPASQPFQAVSGMIEVALSGATGIDVADFAIAIDDPANAIDEPVAVAFAARVNTDDVANASASDDVESAVPVWTVAGNPALSMASPFRRIEIGPTDHRWFGPNAGAPSDQYLMSPVLRVGPGTFSFTFRHRYSFEAPLFDGGVIEISNDGGATWTDIGASASPGYNGMLIATGSNPLRGRQAFVNASAGYPDFLAVTVDLGSAYANQAVQVRFRAGADDNTAAVGWDIDDIAFSGITNTPFHAVIPHAGVCVCPAIALSPATLPASGKNVPYPPTTLTPTAGSGPFTFNVAGLPAGMTPTAPVAGDDVTIAGTPLVDLSGSVTVSGADRFACSFNQGYALTIGVPAVSIGDVAVSEGQTGFTNAVFTVSLSHPSAVPVSVVYATSDGTANHGTDYLPQQGTDHVLTIPALATTGTITIRVKGDLRSEPAETFFVTLSNPVNATLGDAQGVCTILNDDGP
jgi:large repetitive protein